DRTVASFRHRGPRADELQLDASAQRCAKAPLEGSSLNRKESRVVSELDAHGAPAAVHRRAPDIRRLHGAQGNGCIGAAGHFRQSIDRTRDRIAARFRAKAALASGGAVGPQRYPRPGSEADDWVFLKEGPQASDEELALASAVRRNDFRDKYRARPVEV